jgi:DNA (cytosine-5)-methyltransferase 1
MDLHMKKYLKIGGQFSGVGAFDQALKRLGINYENIYQADWDKYARQTYLHNYEEPIYYVKDVHDTPTQEITDKYGSLDIMMFLPPCQAFSLAGKRLGKDDKRGILFFNSHEFIQVNKPRFFIFENVKGLLSDDGGRTFQEWVNMLGGKSVNGLPVLFPVDEAVPYHLYWQVLNAKKHGVPQNRERVFLIGIRDDNDN